jgi:hypothetical protein
MKFEIVKGLDEEKFRRLTGVKRTTFDKMVNILEQSIKSRETTKGRKKKLSIENMLLMTLEYIREYILFLAQKCGNFGMHLKQF